jgi:hypothetical protein
VIHRGIWASGGSYMRRGRCARPLLLIRRRPATVGLAKDALLGLLVFALIVAAGMVAR